MSKQVLAKLVSVYTALLEYWSNPIRVISGFQTREFIDTQAANALANLYFLERIGRSKEAFHVVVK